MPFLTNNKFLFFFQLKNIGEKIRRFVFEKFVITCRELNTDSDQPQQGPLFHSVIYKASDVVHPTASPTSEDGSSEVMYTLYVGTYKTACTVNNVPCHCTVC